MPAVKSVVRLHLGAGPSEPLLPTIAKRDTKAIFAGPYVNCYIFVFMPWGGQWLSDRVLECPASLRPVLLQEH